MLTVHDLFDLGEYEHYAVFADDEKPWSSLTHIEEYARQYLASHPNREVLAQIHPQAVIEGDVYIGEGSHVEPGVYIAGPTVIGRNCEIRQGAYIRGNFIAGDHCVVGHASEVKNSIFLDHAQAPHFAYVGDSILGNRVNLGAGTRLANLPLFSKKDAKTGKRSTIRLMVDGEEIDTGLSKMGAILGDSVQTGCNVVTSPGCIVGARTFIYALVSLGKGVYASDEIIKLRQTTERANNLH